jgi:hypothetical protein
MVLSTQRVMRTPRRLIQASMVGASSASTSSSTTGCSSAAAPGAAASSSVSPEPAVVVRVGGLEKEGPDRPTPSEG